MIRVLLIGDIEDWILGKTARQLSRILSKKFSVTVLMSHSENFHARFHSLKSQHDIVHFLSPWDFFELVGKVHKPCVVVLWHMVDWSVFVRHRFRIDTLCVGSQQWLELSRKYMPEAIPTKRIHYGIDTIVFNHKVLAQDQFFQKNNIDASTLIFGFAGSAWSNEGNRKGLDRLWKCMSRLRSDSDIPFLLRVAGRHWSSDIVPEELRPFVKIELDLLDNELPDFYSSLDYYVCTSRCEGVPYPVLEAMSCECIVLSTPVGIVPEIIKHGENGYILQEISIETDFMNAIHQTAGQPQFRKEKGLSARRTIVENFLWESAINLSEYEDMYEEAIIFFQKRALFSHFILFLKANFLSSIELPMKFAIILKETLKQKLRINIKVNRLNR
jgi:glycosyltransferase involved in cell wall biosynthesis